MDYALVSFSLYNSEIGDNRRIQAMLKCHYTSAYKNSASPALKTVPAKSESNSRILGWTANFLLN